MIHMYIKLIEIKIDRLSLLSVISVASVLILKINKFLLNNQFISTNLRNFA